MKPWPVHVIGATTKTINTNPWKANLMTLSRLLPAAVAALLLPVAALAENVVTIGIGPQTAPGYFGSDEYEAGIGGTLNIDQLDLGPLQFGDAFGDPDLGIGVTASLRVIGERNGMKYPELAGTVPIDAAIEVGGGLTYTTPNFFAFGVVRKGVTGHDALVGELGADGIFAVSQQLELRLGPRLFFGDDDYAQQYFGVTAAEAGKSKTLTQFDAKGGMLSRGVEVSAIYDFNDRTALTGTVRYDQFTNDAADSPIVRQGSDSSTTASLVISRQFSF